MGSVLRTFLFDPGKIVATLGLAQAAKARYLVLLFAPFLGAVWLRPHYLFMLAAALAVNLLTNNHFLFSLGFHYEVELYSLLFVSVALLSRDRLFLRRWRDLTLATSRFFPGLRGVSCRFAWMLTIMALFGGKSLAWYVSAYPISKQIADVRIKLAELSPQWENRRVAASQALIPHLANVRNLYMLDRWKDADWVIVAYPYGQSGWAISREQIENDYVAGLKGNFDLIYSDPSMPTFRVWKRRNLSHRGT